MTTDRPVRAHTRVLVLGECMVELRQTSPTLAQVGIGGDTYNTAVYLARLTGLLGCDVEVGYLTGLGSDSYSQYMRGVWVEEGVTDRSILVADRTPGLYAISTDRTGERSFTYWRRDSAAAAFFQGTHWVDVVAGDYVHFSGITLQLMSERSMDAFFQRLAHLRRQGSVVSFDTNYRPAGWQRQRDPAASWWRRAAVERGAWRRELATAQACAAFDSAGSCADIAFVSVEDEQLLRGWNDPETIAQHYLDLGAREVVVKLGGKGALLAERGRRHHVTPAPGIVVVDTTAAGDSLAAGYLAARLGGREPRAALALGVATASQVIRWPGAIVPRQSFSVPTA